MGKQDLLMLGPYIGQALGNMGTAFGGNVPGLTGAGQAVAQTGGQYAANLEYQRMLEEEEEKRKKKKKGMMGGTLGTLAGAALGLIPGVGPLAAAGLSAAGGITGSSAGEGKFIGPERALKEHVAPAAVSFGLGKLGGRMMKSWGGAFHGSTEGAPLRYKVGELMSNPLANAAMTRALTGATPYGTLATGLFEGGDDMLTSLLGLAMAGDF